MTINQSKPLHNICWLKMSNGNLFPTGKCSDDVIHNVEDIPYAGQLELHWCESGPKAAGFIAGVRATDLNSILTLQGTDGAEGAVLMIRMDRDRTKADTLERAVKLVLHGSTAKMETVTKWKNLITQVEAMHIKGKFSQPFRYHLDENGNLAIRACYSFLDLVDGRPQKGGDNILGAVYINGEQHLTINLKRYKEALKAGSPFIDDIIDMTEPLGWFRQQDKIYLATRDRALKDIINNMQNVFAEINEINERAKEHNRLNEIRDDKTNKRIINAIKKGGTIVDGGRGERSNFRKILRHSDGREEFIPYRRVANMVDAGMLIENGEWQEEVYRVPEPQAELTHKI